jgi:hypothetical protein
MTANLIGRKPPVCSSSNFITTDWTRIRQRYEAWWQGECLDRPLLRVTAPMEPSSVPERPPEEDPARLQWFTDPRQVIPRLERQIADTYWGGDAFPLMFPMDTSFPAIEAAYLGAPYHIQSDTGWSDPIIESWDTRPHFLVDEDNSWWKQTQVLLEAAARRSAGRYAIGIPDLQGGGQILAQLRGMDRLAMDLIDFPEVVLPAIAEINSAWLQYYNACMEIVHPRVDGYVDWLGIWSDLPAVTIECDFAVMVSPAMFKKFFVPALEQQMEWIGRTIYHLDGPGQLPHLKTLLSLPGLLGIQWIPLPGQRASDWIELYQCIQAAGKRLVVACAPEEVQPLMAALKPGGLALSTSCGSAAEASELVSKITRQAG